jgi:hypothetical protein
LVEIKSSSPSLVKVYVFTVWLLLGMFVTTLGENQGAPWLGTLPPNLEAHKWPLLLFTLQFWKT